MNDAIFLQDNHIKNYILTFIIVVLTCIGLIGIELFLFLKIEKINFFNLVLELLLALLFLYPLFAIQNYKSKNFYISLNTGFYLLFFSYFVDGIDQIFIHPIMYTVVFEKLTLLLSVILIFIGFKLWMQNFEKLSLTDDLTQVPNRKLIRQIANKEIVLAKKHNTPMSLAIIDIDLFKNINDQFGHAIGDAVLISFARFLQNDVLMEKYFGRWGGEEFLIVLKNTNIQQAKIVMENIRIKASQLSFRHDGHIIQNTISIGMGELNNKNDDFEKLFVAADKALYLAKNKGRNRTEP